MSSTKNKMNGGYRYQTVEYWLFCCLFFNIMESLLINYSIKTWVSALMGATAVGLIGIFPLFIVPNEQNKSK